MSVENDFPFKRTGSIRDAMGRFRSSMRKKLRFASVRVTKTEKTERNHQRQKQQRNFLRPPTFIEDENYETCSYKGSARDVARRFVTVSRHKAQEGFVAAKLVLKIKRPNSPNISSDEEEESEVGKDFFEGYRLSFSDEEDIFPLHKTERYIGDCKSSEFKQANSNANAVNSNDLT